MNHPFIYITTVTGYEQALRQLESEPRLAIDLETYCKPELRSIVPSHLWALDPHSGGISLLTVCGDQDLPYIFDIILLERRGYAPEKLLHLLQTREQLIAHNAKFEIKFLYQTFGEWLENFRCTDVLANLLGNAVGSKYSRSRGYSLASLLRDWFNIRLTGKGSEQVSDWYPRPEQRKSDEWERKLSYAAADVIYLLPLYDKLITTLTRPLPTTSSFGTSSNPKPNYKLGYQQQRVVELEMQMLVVSAQIEYWGLPCNRDLLLTFESAIEDDYGGGEMYRIANEILETFGYHGEESPYHDYRLPYKSQLQRLNNPHALKSLIQETINSKTADVTFTLTDAQRSSLQRLAEVSKAFADDANEAKILFIDDSEEASYEFVKELSVDALADTSKLVNQILEYKKYAKQAGMQLSKYIHPITGCIHAGFRQAYAATGRSASSNPNSQNINSRLELDCDVTAAKIRESSARS